MGSNRDNFLNNLKKRLQTTVLPGLSPEHPGSFPGYSYDPAATVERLVEQFSQELGALSGRVYRVSDREEVVPLILEIARQHQATSLLAWDEPLPGAAWLAPALSQAGLARQPADLPRDGAGRKAQLAELESLKVGLTGAAGGLADTGAIALVSGPGRSRLASLLPPVHIALLATDRLYPSLPAFLAANPGATGQGSNLVFIAGPSRTGDIELTLSMGVHGPGEIHVIITPPAG